jgi:hypothetical protein
MRLSRCMFPLAVSGSLQAGMPRETTLIHISPVWFEESDTAGREMGAR